MFADVRSRADDFCLADIVVLEENNLEQVTNVGIVVHHGSHRVDEVDNLLGHPVSRGSLATKDGHAGHLLPALLGRHLLQRQVAVNDAENVELLALVLVNTLDLNVKERRRVDRNSGRRLDVFGEADLVGILDFGPLLAEPLVASKLLQLVQLRQILEEAVAAALGSNELRQARVGLVEPSARSDTVGHVGKLVGAVDADKVLEDGGLDEIRVQLSDTVDLVGANNGEVGHANHLGLRFLDNRDATEHVTVVGELPLHLLQKEQVDVKDDLEVAGEQVLEKSNGPLLQSLGENGVVCVAKLAIC